MLSAGSEPAVFARLRAFLAARGRTRRVLLVVGNPLGNAIGDTIMAADHLAYLRQLAPRVEIVVWSANVEVWRFLDPTVRTTALISDEQWAGSFDLIVVEGRAVGATLLERAVRAGVALLQWEAGGLHAVLNLGDQGGIRVSLPPAFNMPSQAALVYEVLGFPRAAPARIKTPPRDEIVFFNPFASNAGRSLSPAFARLLLDAMLPVIGPQMACVVQTRPSASRHDDAEGYERLSDVLDSETYRDRLKRRATDLSGYIRQVTRSRVVVGADTSSQHLAAAVGRPSIAFYPARVTFGFYLVWGPAIPSSLHFVVPSDAEPDRQRALADLTARLLGGWLGRSASGREARAALVSYKLARLLIADARRYVDGDAGVMRRMTGTLARLRARLGAPIFEPVLREFELLAAELPRSGSPAPPARRAVTLQQLDALNSVKVLGWLSGALPFPNEPATARRAGARRSADRGARSPDRASRSSRGRTRAR